MNKPVERFSYVEKHLVNDAAGSLASLGTPKPIVKIGEDAATYDAAKPRPPEKYVALRTIAHLRCLEDNFDGEGTLVPTIDVLDTAERLVNYSFGRMYPTRMYPGIDRTLIMYYERPDIGGKLLVTIETDLVSVTKINLDNSRERYPSEFLPDVLSWLPEGLRKTLPPYRPI